MEDVQIPVGMVAHHEAGKRQDRNGQRHEDYDRQRRAGAVCVPFGGCPVGGYPFGGYPFGRCLVGAVVGHVLRFLPDGGARYRNLRPGNPRSHRSRTTIRES